MPSWLVCRRPKPAARARLVCFPCAGGGPVAYRSWEALLPPSVELHAALLPGRGPRFREAPVADLEALAAPLAEAVRPLAAAGPCALFGHSMGAVLAFAVALKLQEDTGAGPAVLAVAAHAAPGAPRGEGREGLSRRPDDELVAWLGDLGGTPTEALADPELMRLALPPLRADLAAVEDYRPPAARLSCDLLAFAGADDEGVSAEIMAEWRLTTTGRTTVTALPGGHFFVETAAATLVHAVMEALPQL